MWDYSDKVKEHFFNPKNVGEIENADVVAEVGSVACGDALKLYLKIEDGKIIDAKFKTFGCGSAIASSSVLTEVVKGKTLEEAKKISNEEIVKLLDGLPPEKVHCSVMAEDALEKAIKIYNGEKIEKVVGKLVCHCFNVTEEKIIETIKKHNITKVEEVTNYLKAGGACGKCIPKIEEIIKKQLELVENKEDNKMSNLEKIEKIKKVLDEDIRPALQNDGGDVELIDIIDNVVKVKLQGACGTCPMALMTLKSFVEETLKEKVSSDIVVEQ